jgi:hypothetical protein
MPGCQDATMPHDATMCAMCEGKQREQRRVFLIFNDGIFRLSFAPKLAQSPFLPPQKWEKITSAAQNSVSFRIFSGSLGTFSSSSQANQAEDAELLHLFSCFVCSWQSCSTSPGQFRVESSALGPLQSSASPWFVQRAES